MIRKLLRMRGLPKAWWVDLPGSPDAPVAVAITLRKEEPTRGSLTDLIGSARGAYVSREEANAVIRQLRDE